VTHPKISIVTVNYNMGGELAATIESVLGQNYPNLEYVLIDGGSKDNSVDVIRAFSSRIAYWVSERDRNRYDAMNKGATAATGEWVIFMNAGDAFYNYSVVADMFYESHDDADLVYGDVLRRYPKEDMERIVRARSAETLPLQMPCCHQSLFARRAMLAAHPFLTEYPISSDHEFMLWAKETGARFKKIDRVVSIFSKGGTSDIARGSAFRELLSIMRLHHSLTVGVAVSYVAFVLRGLAGLIAKSILPRQLTRRLLLYKNFD
jgi:glycosyltransferase involved in cell wall biosynthesis